MTSLLVVTREAAKIPRRWNVKHAEILEHAYIEIPAWNGVHDGTFDYMEVSSITGLTQAYYYIDVPDRTGTVWRTVARCIVKGNDAVVDHFFEPVLKK